MTSITLACTLGSDAPLDEIGALRRNAWEPIVGADLADDRFGIDDEDHTAWHVVVSHDDALVATGRLALRTQLTDLPESTSFSGWTHSMVTPLGFASRLAVHPAKQGKGLAERVIAERLTLSRRLGLAQVWGETRTGHVHGLERHGYRVLGPSADASVPGEWHILCAPLSPAGEAALAQA